MVILEPAQIFQLILSLAAILRTLAIARPIWDVDLVSSISTQGFLSSQNFNLLRLCYNFCRFVV